MRLVFLAYPMSKAAAERLGEGFLDDQRRALALAEQRLGVPVFGNTAVWPDRYFVDNAHLNRKGRERFLGELAAWERQRTQ